MRFLLLFCLFSITGCVTTSDNSFKYDELENAVKVLSNFETPKDNLYYTSFLCFEDYNNNSLYKPIYSFEIESEFGSSHYESFFHWTENENTNESSIGNWGDLSDINAEGLVVDFSLTEDENGEFFSKISFSMKKFIKTKTFEGQSKDVFHYVEFKKDYYPKNKTFFKIFEDQNLVCYNTTNW